MNLPSRYPLALLPTPLHRAPGLERALGHAPIWIKRDDLTGFGVAGNKARALEFLVGDALAGGADTLIAIGSTHSNFCAATALAAHMAGIDCDIVYAGGEPAEPPSTVALAAVAGARLHFNSDLGRDELEREQSRLAAQLAANGAHPYLLPRGGSTPVGAAGFALAASEFAAQCAALGIEPGIAVLPAGSGCSLAGLLAGSADLPGWRLVGASVSRPADGVRAHVADLAERCAALIGAPPPDLGRVDVRDAVGAGFGVAQAADAASAGMARQTAGLLLDSTYGAKAMTVFADVARVAPAGLPLVFWCTGGLPEALHNIDAAAASLRAAAQAPLATEGTP